MSPLLFALALGLLLLAPGPTNTLLALAGMERRGRLGLLCLVAALVGYLIAILPLHFLAAPTLLAHPRIAQLVAALAAVWVALLAARLWDAPMMAGHAGTITPRLVFLTTLVNPKGLVIALTLLPTGFNAAFLICLAVMLVLIPAISGLWLLVGASLIHRLSTRHPALVMRSAAVALLLFSAGLASRAAGLI